MKLLIGATAMLVCFYFGQWMFRSGMRLQNNGQKIGGWFRIFCSIQFFIYPMIGMATILSSK